MFKFPAARARNRLEPALHLAPEKIFHPIARISMIASSS
jgi:hypothetical protein